MLRQLRHAARSMAAPGGRALATSAPQPTPRVAVIGGGIAGLTAAQELVRHGLKPVLMDMAACGGRLASRAADAQLSFDHGAQFFTARSPDFRRQVAEWQAAGVVQEWAARRGVIAGDAFKPLAGSAAGGGFFGALDGGLPLYVGTPTNNALAQHMARQLEAAAQLRTGCLVQAAERIGGGSCGGGGCGGGSQQWQLRGSRRGREAATQEHDAQQEALGEFDALVLADAMPLLPGSAGHVAGLADAATSLAQLARSVQQAAPEPCFALMLAFAQPLPGVPFDAAAVGGGGSSGDCSDSSGAAAFQWVACNSSKPGRPGGGAPQCWVALTTARRAARLLEARPLVTAAGRFSPQTRQYQQAVAEELLADFSALLRPFVDGALPAPAHVSAQRWGRAFPQPLGAEFLLLPAQRLALCGDAAAGGGVEGAWRSGRAAGQAVAAMLASAA